MRLVVEKEKGLQNQRNGKRAVFISQCFCNKLQQIWWLKKMFIYYLTVLEARSPK